jgi:hypothetical protein
LTSLNVRSEEHSGQEGSKRGRFASTIRALVRNRWSFPLALLFPLVILTILGIHGSSVGVYNRYLFGPSYDDPDLLFGRPQPIRSDEWLVVTPYIVSQANNDYPRVNPDLAYGQDMSLVVNVPYREWSVLFKPHNLAFLALPLENAYAFQWWFLGYLLMVSFYFFVLELVPKRNMLAAVLAVALFLSPFIQWWYQASVLATLTFALLSLIAFMRLLDAGRLLARLGWTLALAYFLASFVLIMYPPFQISSATASVILAVGLLANKYRDRGIRRLLVALGFVAAALLVAGAVIAVFVMTRLETVRTILGTVYPGGRSVDTGVYAPSILFSTYLLPLLQSSTRAANYYVNQSEGSNFVFVSPFLLIPSAYALLRDRRRGERMDIPLALVSAGIIILTMRILGWGPGFLSALFLLDQVSDFRLLIGLGLLGFIQVVLLHRKLIKGRVPGAVGWSSGLVATATFIVAGIFVSSRYPGFVKNPALIVGLSLIAGTVVFLYSSGRSLPATMLLAGFSLASVVYVNPLYRGLGPLNDSNLTKAITSVAHDERAWVVVDSLIFEQFPLAQGQQSFAGTYAYPQLEVWHVIDPRRMDENVYNRYAHVVFESQTDSLELRTPDYFVVPFEACSRFAREHDIGYVLSPHALPNTECLSLEAVVRYPAIEFDIYRVT